MADFDTHAATYPYLTEQYGVQIDAGNRLRFLPGALLTDDAQHARLGAFVDLHRFCLGHAEFDMALVESGIIMLSNYMDAGWKTLYGMAATQSKKAEGLKPKGGRITEGNLNHPSPSPSSSVFPSCVGLAAES